MTSTTGTDRHPDIEEISALAEGLLPPERSATVRDHVTGCAPCSEVLSSLEEIGRLLGALPDPGPMPDDVAGRLDAALAAEKALTAGEKALTAGESGTSGRPEETTATPSEAVPVSRETRPAVSRETTTAVGHDEPAGAPRSAASRGPGGRPRGTTGPGRDSSARG
ncbi:anti-sigma factor family protein, partial [Streptomyces sp. URMC 123]|uniref:anti-sigma factor family protein n=1 Tax=Streptomyces sp. URMC 123 TaxID=3423403 RepID=UPI003F19D9EA